MLCGLLDERESLDEGVWINALCIDQKNESEKHHAIGCMDLVYKSARKVVIVLEDVVIFAREEALLQGLLSDRGYDFSELKEGDMRTMTCLLIRILSARWSTRAWCSHELQVGTRFVFLIPTTRGFHKMTPASLEDLYTETQDFRETHQDLEELYVHYESYDFLSRSIYLAEDRVGRSLMSEFNDNMKLGCAVETDKISISINAVGLQLLFSGPHRSRDQCRWTLAMIALSAGDATVLGGIEEALSFDKEDRADVAESWFRWQDEFEDPMTKFGGSRLREPSFITSIDLDHITLDLLYFQSCTPKEPTLHSLQCAGNLVDCFLKLCQSNDIDSVPYQMSGQKVYPTYRTSLIEFLACSLDFGLDWMTQQMAFSKPLAEKIQSQLEKLQFDLWPALRSLLLALDGSDPANAISLTNEERLSALQYIFFILSDGMRLIQTRSLYRSGLFENAGQEEFRSLGLDMNKAGKGVIPLGFGALRPSLKTRIFALPVALSESSCAAVSRLWILEQVDGPRNTWKVIEKLQYFTLMPISEDETNVIRLKDQTIVG